MGSRWRDAGISIADRLFQYRFVQQFAALFYKNVLVAWRSRRSTALRLFAPFIFLLMALVVNLALNANNSLQERFTAVPFAAGSSIPPIPPCGDDLYIAGRPCVDFVWSPANDTAARAIVQAVMASNDPPIPPDKVLGFNTRSEAEDYMSTHPDGCLGAVTFVAQGASGSFSYIVTSNSTVKYFKGTFQDPVNFFQVPLINAVARELSRSYVARARNTTSSSSSSSSSSSAVNDLLSSPDAFEWSPRLVRFPHPSLQTVNLLGQVLSSFIFASLMFGSVSQISGLVCERDAGLRLSLANMGMRQAPYWVSWMAYDALLTFATALLMVLFGMLLRFSFFLRNDFSLLLMLFWLFSLAMTSFSYTLSCLVKKPQAAMYIGFSVFIVGWMFQTIQFLVRLPYTPSTYYSTSNKWGRVFFWVFALYPWNPLTKGILDLNEATLAPTDPGLRWSQLYSYCKYQPDPAKQSPYDPHTEFRSYDCIYPLWQVYLTLLLQWTGYWLWAVYLSNVLPNEVGACRPWNYYLRPSYWRPRPTDTTAALQQLLADEAAAVCRAPVTEGGAGSDPDPDVTAEEAKMRRLLEQRAGLGLTPRLAEKDTCSSSGSSSSTPSTQYAAELYGLRKVFKGGRTPLRCRPTFMCGCSSSSTAAGGDDTADGQDGLLDTVTAGGRSGSSSGRSWLSGGRRRDDFWAIRGTWLGIERGQLFCLLGPNGAGKTTTIHTLTGVLPFSGGDALIYGSSIKGEAGLDAVRPLMGVCPQFDVLWGELSGREHLTIAGHIKGLPWNKVSAQVRDLLSRVHLSHASNVRSASYSGGMKRRLSVALALLGDPQIVYLDEPTTGMDPISRRHVWDIISAAKAGRAIVLTTHSMEEADVLGDRIGIMARGTLRALGSSLRLKQKYGSGYQLTVHVGAPGPMPPQPADAAAAAGLGVVGQQPSRPEVAAARQQQLAAQLEGVKQLFRSDLGLEPADEGRDSVTYLVGADTPHTTLVSFLQRLEAASTWLGVEDIQASLASLEEVFLNIAKQAELEAAAATGSSLVCVDLPGGSGRLMVPLGEEEVVGPDATLYAIKWAQDDEGRLVVLSCTAKPHQLQTQQWQRQQEQQQGAVELQQWHWQQQQQTTTQVPLHGELLQSHTQSGQEVVFGQLLHQRQQQQQQLLSPRPVEGSAPVLEHQGSGVAGEHLPHMSECTRTFTPTHSTAADRAGPKPHRQ